MDIYDETRYLLQKQDWVRYRLNMLDKIEAMLIDMRSIAVLAENINMDTPTRQKLNQRFHALEKEVARLDEESRTFRMNAGEEAFE